MTGLFTYPQEPCAVCGMPANWAKDERTGPWFCDQHNKERLAEELKQKQLAVKGNSNA